MTCHGDQGVPDAIDVVEMTGLRLQVLLQRRNEILHLTMLDDSV